MEMTGTITNGTVVLDVPYSIPEGTKVKVRVERAVEVKSEMAPSAVGKRLLKHAGTVAGLPADMAEQHDHYLHGTPKK